ncbi:hypothetical protein L6164_031110 [Bauhinia variegata]|uniref:Uncharacterized protein n=1 Tax=Bauhinia variegata TaxID=167791 RepID=A0ACB9LEF3_BAUVA|nr:hypothetical protein L6164_031110 [Bauhinia variegata]
MASILSNPMSFHSPISRINKFSDSGFLPLSIPNRVFCSNVKAMGGVARNSLDNLPRPKQQQLQPKTNRLQTSPTVLLNQFPAARSVQQMMDTMEKIMEDPLAYSTASPLIVARENGDYSKGKMPWAIREGEKYYKLRFNMPGMNKNDVKVWIEENMLVVKAEKVATVSHEGEVNGSIAEESEENEDWPAKSYGRYSHRIALPENIEFEKIKAQVRDGVLYITIPKANGSGKIIGINVQ